MDYNLSNLSEIVSTLDKYLTNLKNHNFGKIKSEHAGDLKSVDAAHYKYLNDAGLTDSYSNINKSYEELVNETEKWYNAFKTAKEKIEKTEKETNKNIDKLSGEDILGIYKGFTKGFKDNDVVYKYKDKDGKTKSYTKKQLLEKIEKKYKDTNAPVTENGVDSKVPSPTYIPTGGVITAGTVTTIPAVVVSEPPKDENISKPTTKPEVKPTEPEKPNVSTNDTTNPGIIGTPATDQKEPVADNNNSQTNDEIVEKPPVQTPTSSNENTTQPTQKPSQSSHSTQGFGQMFENKDSNFDQTSIATSITETTPNGEVETTLPLDSENPVTNPFGNLFDNEDIVTSNPTYDSDTSKSSGFNPVPLGVGLGLATAGGVGAKILYDHRKNSELESDEDESFGNKFWADDEVGEINSEEENYEDERMDEMLSSTETKENYSASYDAPATDDSNWKLDDTDFAANDELSDLLSGN